MEEWAGSAESQRDVVAVEYLRNNSQQLSGYLRQEKRRNLHLHEEVAQVRQELVLGPQ